MNPLLELIDHGQSYWMDNLTRWMLRTGDLERRVREEGLRGITSNPKIFSDAIGKSDDYDEQIRELVAEGRSVEEIYEALVVSDIRDACDVLRPVHRDSDGVDGFASLEVSPHRAHDTEGSLAEARRLAAAVDRPNVLVKIPGTAAGLPAIEELLFEGISVNVTLLFSVARYEDVAEAYLRALERRVEAGRDPGAVASVASFFLSRIDSLVDPLLARRIRPEAGSGAGADPLPPERLQGRTAVANAKQAYQSFKRLFSGERWEALRERGAKPQRLLWASTGTKNPLYNDLLYVEPLIGPDTVNTLPEPTIAAFARHGRVASTVEDGVAEASRVLEGVEAAGVDMTTVTAQLLEEGVQKFVEPFDDLLGTLATKRRRFLGREAVGETVGAGPVEGAASGVLAAFDQQRFGARLWGRDPYLWTSDPGDADAIGARLGWLDAPDAFLGEVEALEGFAREAREAGIEDVVLLGMGGSSLCPEVCARIFGPARGWPVLRVLDDTSPTAVREVDEGTEPSRTLFVVASKSGTTSETLAFYRYFWERTRAALPGGSRPGDHFVAIADPGTPLAEEARERGFRRVFENPSDIGGRYSALSYFGLVPMALLGMEIGPLLRSAAQMRWSCGPLVPSRENPGLRVGTALGAAAAAGRDKATVSFSETLRPFGHWLEQLLAESTGKEGKGIVPVVDEPPGEPDSYGADRIFVHFELDDGDGTAGGNGDMDEARLERLEAAGHPVVRIRLASPTALGAEFYRWEVATAAAGAVLGVNPFDEPNVTESKDNTRRLLAEWQEKGALHQRDPDVVGGPFSVYLADGAWTEQVSRSSPEEAVASFLALATDGDYVSLLAYLPRTPEHHRSLQHLREGAGRRGAVATTLGFGPRYLHSTGQLHKGGGDRGIHLLLTADSAGTDGDEAGPAIPEHPYDFATLHRAQALGDFRALESRGRRVVRIHLSGDSGEALERLARSVNEATPNPNQTRWEP